MNSNNNKELDDLVSRMLGHQEASEAKATQMSANDLVYTGRLRVDHEVNRQISQYIDTHCKGPNPTEWMGLGTGEARKDEDGQAVLTVTDLFSAGVSRLPHSMLYDMNEVKKIDGRHQIVLDIHAHPSRNVKPSETDLYSFVSLDLNLGRPILHVISDTGNNRLILSFARCYTSHFMRLMKLWGYPAQEVM